MRTVSWPVEPYKGLAYYSQSDVLLFSGRTKEADNCTAILAEPRTRTLLLHGRTGCGKSSFIRAGLIPELETEGFGFVFLRRGADDEPVIIRCTADPVMRVAEELFQFTQQLQRVSTAIGPATVDLSKARQGLDTLADFAKSCRDPFFLLKVLKAVADQLHYTLVIVIDQAEEVLTGDDYVDAAENENQAPFFEFLKLFNASTLNVKLVVSLRTENFGEFFDHLHFDASAVTDVKQVPLRRLARPEVRYAIELPTSRAPIGDYGSPYDAYRFEYEPGLVDRIVDDLFAVDPSGGILPAMQIVCRDLFHEVRDQTSRRLVTLGLYASGGGVAGRVDKHISQSLRNAILESKTGFTEPERRSPRSLGELMHTVITDLRFDHETRATLQPDMAGMPNADPEKRVDQWRSALARLARREADGTVRTDVVTEANLLAILAEMRVTDGVESILAYLVRPDVLILRKFSIVDRTTGTEVEAYSLGHDAIGLVLQQWTLRRDEELKLLDSERRASRLRRVAAAAVLTAFVVVALSSALFIVLLDTRLRQAIKSLDTYAEKAVDPHLAATASILAFRKTDSLWFLPPDSRTTADVAKMISELPRSTIPIVDGDQNAKSSPMLYFISEKLAVWNGISKVQMIDARTGNQLYVVDFSKSLSGWSEPSLDKVIEVEVPNLYLFLFRDGRQEQSRTIIVGALGQDIILTKSEDEFLELSKHLKESHPAKPRLRANARMIFLVEFNRVDTDRGAGRETIFAEAFNPVVRAGQSGVAFESAGWIDLDRPRDAIRYINPIYPGISVRETDVASKRLNEIRFYDLTTGKNDLRWSSRQSRAKINDCINFCIFDRFNNGKFISVYVPTFVGDDHSPINQTLTVVDMQQAKDMDVGEKGNATLFDRAPVLFSRERVVGGSGLESMIMGIKRAYSGEKLETADIIELFQISGGMVRKLTNLICPTIRPIKEVDDVPNQVSITQDGSVIAYIGMNEVYLWDTSEESTVAQTDRWMKRSPDDLVEELCRQHMPRQLRSDEDEVGKWKEATGSIEIPPDLCAAKQTARH